MQVMPVFCKSIAQHVLPCCKQPDTPSDGGENASDALDCWPVYGQTLLCYSFLEDLVAAPHRAYWCGLLCSVVTVSPA